jgi:hypothetical protein
MRVQSLLAYHLEALVPTASSPQVRAAPQRLSPGKDIVFFTVGQLSGRTLVLYMKKRGVRSFPWMSHMKLIEVRADGFVVPCIRTHSRT